jgi:hypothetical protein
MCKNSTILRDIVFPHLPAFEDREIQKFALKNPEVYNIERLVELTLAHVGKMQFVDETGYDFLPDYSDSKTVTINANSLRAQVGSVENKIGALRISAYNAYNDSMAYFFVPKIELNRIKEPCYGVNEYKDRIRFTYSTVYEDSYGYFDEYRVASFTQLAEIR